MNSRSYNLPFGLRLVVMTELSAMRRDLERRKDLLDNPRTVLEKVASIMRADFRQQFAQGGIPAWKALAASTVASKQAAGLPARTAKGRVPWRLKQNGQFGASNKLIRSGRLRDAWGRKDSPDHLEVIDVKNKTVDVGVKRDKIPYALWMQTGTRPRRITAKTAGGLAFTVAGGKVIVRKAVNHPGVPARPVRVTEQARRQIFDYVSQALSNQDSGETDRLDRS